MGHQRRPKTVEPWTSSNQGGTRWVTVRRQWQCPPCSISRGVILSLGIFLRSFQSELKKRAQCFRDQPTFDDERGHFSFEGSNEYFILIDSNVGLELSIGLRQNITFNLHAF